MCGCVSRRGVLAAGVVTLGEGRVEPRLRVPAGVALTLDACMGGFDLRVMRALVAMEVMATVFVTGLWIRQNPAGVAFLREHARLFPVANHGARHLPCVPGGRVFGIAGPRDLEGVREEVLGGAAALREAFGVESRWFRGATAVYGPGVVAAIEGWGFRVAGYSLNGDAGASAPAAVVAGRISRAREGDVILAHVNHPARASGAGVVEGVQALVGRGVRFVGLEQAISG